MKKSAQARLIFAGLAIVALGGFIWWHTKPAQIESRRTGLSETPLAVTVMHPESKDMPVVIQETGSVEAEETVNIIAQATGVLKKINISQGQTVKAGQLLFELDPAVYIENVAGAQANLSRDLAQLEFLKSTASRYEGLAKLEYVTRQQYDQAVAAVKQQEAVISADKAQLKEQNIQLNYTKIRSPISGRAGAISVHVGDLIFANNTTPLVVINRLENVLVNFNIPQDRLRDLLAYQRAGTLQLSIFNESGDQNLGSGELVFVGNMVSGQTGTVQLKGKAANPDWKLWPGQLVTVRLTLTSQPLATVIPSASVQLGQKGSYVYLVKDNKAVIQPIEVDREFRSETIVAKGLKPQDQVIIEIPPGLHDGSQVQVMEKP